MSDLNIKKIAIPMAQERFSAHFGQTTAFAVVEVDMVEHKIIRQSVQPLPGAHACGMAGWLREQKIDAVIVGGMGSGALANLSAAKIEVLAALPPVTPEALAQAYMDGRLKPATSSCGHGHEPGHEHGHGNSHGHAEGHTCQCQAGSANSQK